MECATIQLQDLPNNPKRIRKDKIASPQILILG